MSFKIEKGIPLPKPRAGGLTATLRAMEPEDSVLVTPDHFKSVNSTIYHVKKTTGYQFTTRNEGDNRRVWRIK